MVQKVEMPERLDWALEGLVRAVLLHQPEDIYLFAAQHFDKIVQSRQSDDDDAPIKIYDKDIPTQENVSKTIILPSLNESLTSDNVALEDGVTEQQPEEATDSEKNIIEDKIFAEQANIVAEVPETEVSELEQDVGVEESEGDKVPPTEEVDLLDINTENIGASDVSQTSEKIIEVEGAEEAEKGLEDEDITEAEKSVDAEEAEEKVEVDDSEKDVEVEDAEKSVDAQNGGEAEEKVEVEDAEKDVEIKDDEKDVEVEDTEKVVDVVAGETENIVDDEDVGDAEKLVDVDDSDEAVKSVDVENVGEAENMVEVEDIGDAVKLVDVDDTDEAVNGVDVEDVGENEKNALVEVTEEAAKTVEVEGGEKADQTTEDGAQQEDDKTELNASSEEKIETVDDADVVSATDSQNIQNPEIILLDTEENPGENTGESLKDIDQIESAALDENIDTSLDDTIQTEPDLSEMNSEINILPSSLPEVVLSEDNSVPAEAVEPLIVKESTAVTNVQPSESQDNEVQQNAEEKEDLNDDTGSIEISEAIESNPEVENSAFSPSAPPLEPESFENNDDTKDKIQTNEAEQNNLEDVKDDDKNSEETENNEEPQKAPEEETENPGSSEIIANDTVDEAKGETIAEGSTEAAESLNESIPAQDDDNKTKEEEAPQNDSAAETNVLKLEDSETSNDNEVAAVEQPSEELESQNSNESNTQVTDEVLPSEPEPEKSDLEEKIVSETNNDVPEQEPNATQEASEDTLVAPEAEDAPSLTEITSQEINETEVNSKSEVDDSEKEAPLTGTDFLRSSGEFHDMIVVLPDDALNTSNDADEIETLDSKTEDAQPTEEEGDDGQEGAATKIQASYRGYRTRKKLKKMPAETETSEEQSSLDEKTVTTNPEDKTDAKNEAEDVVNDENTGEVILTDNGVDDTEGNEAAAATVIQSTYRGYRSRKSLKQTEEQKGTLSAETINNSEDVITADSTDKNEEGPSQDDLNEAATKIQASARGYMERKKISRSNEAATTIQKNYRGYRTRKNITKSANTDTGTSNVPNDSTP